MNLKRKASTTQVEKLLLNCSSSLQQSGVLLLSYRAIFWPQVETSIFYQIVVEKTLDY
jgi:hypothetical protein